MQRDNRRDGHEFTHIIVDEAHHAVSASYRAILDHYEDAKILGVTATSDRGDKRNLGEVFETLAYEYTMPRAIRDGWLAPIKAQTIPLSIDMSGVKTTAGDLAVGGIATALDPYLEQIAGYIATDYRDRKTVVFLPLIATSRKFAHMLRARGIDAREVNGESKDRAGILSWFAEAGPGSVLCNAMLLTEGWDQPDVDCICVLRPTKIRSLYVQMIGRGTRICDGKADLLLLDFLWHSDRHELCRPAHLICEDPEISRRVAEILAEESQGDAVDLLEAEEAAEGAATEEREESLRKELDRQRAKRKGLVDPLQYEMSIDHQHKHYTPPSDDIRALAPPSDAQLAALERAGISAEGIMCQGHASAILGTIAKRRTDGMTTPKQIRCL
jgi:superfamily II DNA or RNA helicase